MMHEHVVVLVLVRVWFCLLLPRVVWWSCCAVPPARPARLLLRCLPRTRTRACVCLSVCLSVCLFVCLCVELLRRCIERCCCSRFAVYGFLIHSFVVVFLYCNVCLHQRYFESNYGSPLSAFIDQYFGTFREALGESKQYKVGACGCCC